MSSNSTENHCNEKFSQFRSPSCSCCITKDESKFFCTICKFLCKQCDFSHKLMMQFRSHKVISLKEIANIEQLEKALREVESEVPIYNDDGNVQEMLTLQFLEGREQIERVKKMSLDVQKQLDLLITNYDRTMMKIENLYRQYEVYLAQVRNQFVSAINYEYDATKKWMSTQLNSCNEIVKDKTFKLSNIKLIIGDTSDNAYGFDFSKLDKNEQINGFHQDTLSPWSSLNSESSQDPHESIGYKHSFDDLSLDLLGLAERTEVLNLNSTNLMSHNFSNTYTHDQSTNSPTNTCSISESDLSINTNQVNSMKLYKTFGQKGTDSGQFNSPHGLCLGVNEDIVVADSNNHRIQIFDKFGHFKFVFGLAGRHDGYLWYPRKVAFLPYQTRYVVCDRGYERSRIQIFNNDGSFFKKVYIHYIDIVAGVTVTSNEEIVIVDSVTPTVFIISQNDSLRTLDLKRFMQEPSDVAAVGNQFFICDFKAHNIVVIDHEGQLLQKFGSKNRTNFPNGIDVSLTGDILICDSHGNYFHIVIYSKEGEFIAEYRCPTIKVSRCCGLKVTSEGRLISVDKNFHHVIVMESLFVPPESFI